MVFVGVEEIVVVFDEITIALVLFIYTIYNLLISLHTQFFRVRRVSCLFIGRFCFSLVRTVCFYVAILENDCEHRSYHNEVLTMCTMWFSIQPCC